MQVIDIHSDAELSDVARLFFGDDFPNISLNGDGRRFELNVGGVSSLYDYSAPVYSAVPPERREKRLAKVAVYDCLSALTGAIMPWGALTGVRPSKLFYECLASGMDSSAAMAVMRDVYRVSERRAHVLADIIDAQSGKKGCPANSVDLYVHVPYCTTRCSYCSFVSAPVSKRPEQVDSYVRLLCDEVVRSLDYLVERGKTVHTVYVGGGTPTALDPDKLDMLLSAIGRHDCEYTVEAGRPDTVTPQKLDIIKSHGVTRVCVNPQTLCNDTLVAIGRAHTVDDFFRAYELVEKRGFNINCDLIAGLAGEDIDCFVNSFEGVRALRPHNITVHSLSKKNGSAIRYDSGMNAAASQMTEYALDHAGEYRPYYLYRQKRQAGNLENVGFSLPGAECVNNITVMEETSTVMACGAGAISKILGDGNITRFANMRDIGLYIQRYDEQLDKKLKAFNGVFCA